MRKVVVGAIVATLFASGTAVAQSADPGRDSVQDINKPQETQSEMERRAIMFGRWYGETTTEGGQSVVWIADRTPAGLMVLTFCVREQDGTYTEHRELLEWGISGPVYFMITKAIEEEGQFVPTNPSYGYYYDAYKIIDLQEGVIEFEHYVTGDRFTGWKMDKDTKFPPDSPVKRCLAVADSSPRASAGKRIFVTSAVPAWASGGKLRRKELRERDAKLAGL